MERRLALLKYIRAQSDELPEAIIAGWLTEQIRYALFVHNLPHDQSNTWLSYDVRRGFEDAIASIETYDLQESLNAASDSE